MAETTGTIRAARWALVLVALAAVAAACGEDSGGAGGDAEPAISIESPAPGDDVQAPFTLELSSSVDLGSPDTGDYHVHLYFDGNEDEYEVVEATSFEVTGLGPGEHTIEVSLRNADHSSAGAEDEVDVTVSGGSGGGSSDDGGYDY